MLGYFSLRTKVVDCRIECKMLAGVSQAKILALIPLHCDRHSSPGIQIVICRSMGIPKLISTQRILTTMMNSKCDSLQF